MGWIVCVKGLDIYVLKLLEDLTPSKYGVTCVQVKIMERIPTHRKQCKGIQRLLNYSHQDVWI